MRGWTWSPRWPTWSSPRWRQARSTARALPGWTRWRRWRGSRMIRGESKVTRAHQARAAIVYVRQSTLMQVREHTESTMRQYDLATQAARLGWAGTDIEVIDADLGLSGRSATHRDGFKQLVARVCLGEVGAGFRLEGSRLGRSHARLDPPPRQAPLTDTPVIPHERVTN